MVQIALLVIACACLAAQSDATLNVKLIDRLFLPNENGEYKILERSVTRSSFHAKSRHIYSVGMSTLHVIDANDAYKLSDVDGIHLPKYTLNNVKVHKNYVLVVAQDKKDPRKGYLLIFPIAKDGSLGAERKIKGIHTYWSQPRRPRGDRLRKVVIALSGRPFDLNGKTIDPPGGVEIIHFADPHDFFGKYKDKTLYFDVTKKQLAALERRNLLLAPGVSFTNDVEPRSVVLNDKETVAFVTLQLINAVAKISLKTDKVLKIRALGSFNWLSSRFDPSDKDGGPNLNPHPVHGIFQPDGLAFVRQHKKGFLLLANEGAFRTEQSVRGKSIAGDIAPSVDPRVAEELSDDAQLGRLHVSVDEGKDKNGRYWDVFTFGARSFSVRAASSAKLLFDTDDEIEAYIEQLNPDIFNAEIIPNEVVKDTADLRSDDLGPETDSIVTGVSGGQHVIAIGSEVPGIIHLYTWTDDVAQPFFQSVYSGIKNVHKTWKKLYKDRETGDLGLKVNEFISEKDSPTGNAMILVTGRDSGTVSLLEIVHQ